MICLCIAGDSKLVNLIVNKTSMLCKIASVIGDCWNDLCDINASISDKLFTDKGTKNIEPHIRMMLQSVII
jgi:hypothetical protein